MDSVEKEAKTVEEAVRLALDDLGVSEEEVKIDILSEPNKGFLGMVGGRPARVRVTAPLSLLRPRSMLSKMLHLMNVDATVQERETDDGIELEVKSPDSAILIGRKGKNLTAVQYLINRMYNHGRLNRCRILVDVEAYHERRRQSLEDLARRTAEKVKRNKREVKLEVLSPQDRRSIHMALQDDPAVRTYSVGSGAYRNVVIAPSDNGHAHTESRSRQ
jgi:spoIIIJ-associated protein